MARCRLVFQLCIYGYKYMCIYWYKHIHTNSVLFRNHLPDLLSHHLIRVFWRLLYRVGEGKNTGILCHLLYMKPSVKSICIYVFTYFIFTVFSMPELPDITIPSVLWRFIKVFKPDDFDYRFEYQQYGWYSISDIYIIIPKKYFFRLWCWYLRFIKAGWSSIRNFTSKIRYNNNWNIHEQTLEL